MGITQKIVRLVGTDHWKGRCDMERLTIRIDGEAYIEKVANKYCEDVCSSRNRCNDCPIRDAFNKLAHYEDLEEQGRLIEVVKCKDCSCFEEITAAYNYYFCNRYGGIVTENDYCSRAEVKLKELKGE